MDYDLVIQNGTIIDGTGEARFNADLGIKDGIITAIEPGLDASEAGRTIDASGRIVAPGVIDLHTHYDAQIHWDPHCTGSSWHGTTTVVVGNCGFGFAPCEDDPKVRDRYMLMMQNTEQVPYAAMRDALGWNWTSFPEYMKHLRSIPKGVNLATYLPMNPLMIYVMGVDAAKSRPATEEEREKMRELLNEAMDAGAIGFAFSYLQEFNTHVDYDGTLMPTDGMAIEEAYNLAQVLRERGEGMIHALVEVPGATNHREVAAELARISGRPVLHNIITPFDALDTHREVLTFLDECAEEGLQVYSQSFSHRAWTEFNAIDNSGWDFNLELREFTSCGDAEDKVRKAADPDFRRRMRENYDPAIMIPAGGPIDTWVLIDAHGSERFSRYEGSLMGIVAESEDLDITDAFFEIVVDTRGKADFRTSDAMSHDIDLHDEILRNKRVVPGTSDGGAHVKFYSGGQYSTDLLTWMVREEGRFSLEEMHWRLSSLPAKVVGLSERGELREGYAADLIIYDLERLNFNRERYDLVHDLPGGEYRRVCRPEGIDQVIVAGETIVEGGDCTTSLPGRILTNHSRAQFT